MEEQRDEQLWKRKYLDALDELEAKERRWAQTEQLLRQGLTRLSLAADTNDSELGRLLEQLRRALRTGIDDDELRGLLERLVEPIRRLDEARKAHTLPPTANVLLEEILARIEFPRGMGHRAKNMQKHLLQAGDVPWRQLLDEFVALLTDTLRWQQEEAGPQTDLSGKAGLLDRWLPTRDKGEKPSAQEDPELARQVLDTMLERLADHRDIDQDSLRERVRQSQQQAEILRLGRELAGLLHLGPPQTVVDGEELSGVELMLRLLERLEVPVEMEGDLSAIRDLLAHPDVVEHMEQVIAAIADLVRAMRQRLQEEKNEIENFLSQLTERLREIDEGIQHNASNQREAYEGGRRLNRQMDEHIDGIAQSVNLAQDMDSLKQSLADRVDTIRSHMQQFRQDQDQRLEQAERQVALLNDRLQGMQNESEQLRERVKHQRDLAMLDSLTGVPNRLAYNERIALEHARWRRYGHDLVMAVWDVDRFKNINDTYGHQAGDKVLTVIAKLLQRQVRETDFVARYGGEEFVVLMPETGLEGAQKLAELLRDAVEQCEFHFRGKRVPITISCGISGFQGEDTPAQVFARADAALYRAKEMGRNRCIVA